LPPRPKTAWLLTGAPGIGKTTVVQKTLSLLQNEEDDKPGPDGFVMDVNGTGSGYDLVSLNGKRVPLATAGEHDFADPVPVTLADGAQLAVDRDAVESMVRETLALAVLGQTAVIDEIGLLLIASDNFSNQLWWLLEYGSGMILATITPHSHPFIDRIKAHPAVELVEVTVENREALPAELAERFAGQPQLRDGLTLLSQ
jgi:nucleoside-triphosphatase THEP1